MGACLPATGKISIKQTQYKDDAKPVDEACGCYTCQNFSRAYLRHLFQAGEMTFSTLATLHNLQRYLDIMREIRQAILIGKYPEYLRAQSRGTINAIFRLFSSPSSSRAQRADQSFDELSATDLHRGDFLFPGVHAHAEAEETAGGRCCPICKPGPMC